MNDETMMRSFDSQYMNQVLGLGEECKYKVESLHFALSDFTKVIENTVLHGLRDNTFRC